MCLRPTTRPSTPNFLPVVQTANLSLRERKRKAKQDPYRWAQAQQRKNANLERRKELQEQRDDGSDAIYGNATPFIESLYLAGHARASELETSSDGQPGKSSREPPTPMGLRNHFITDAELEQATNDAFALTTPAVGVVETQMSANNTEDLKEKQRQNHVKVVEALQRITSLENSSARDRFHVNVRRVVDELGRHNTDGVLKPKPQSIRPNTEPLAPRAGPDTGSSEVQIGILTAKIRNLAKTLEVNRGRNDKHNKRNLRVLLHKRQKLLRYMHAKERGSERWTNMVEKLGITPAMWQGQIDL